ncbi:dendritic cell-specific transmembrane protein-like [Diretmus argenteus]
MISRLNRLSSLQACLFRLAYLARRARFRVRQTPPARRTPPARQTPPAPNLLGITAQGALVRSRFMDASQMDAPSQFFFGLERKNGQRKIMHSLRTENGSTIVETPEIRRYATSFYRELYKEEYVEDIELAESFYAGLPQADICESVRADTVDINARLRILERPVASDSAQPADQDAAQAAATSEAAGQPGAPPDQHPKVNGVSLTCAVMPFTCCCMQNVGFLAVDVYTTGNREGVRRTIILLLTCSLFSLLLSSLLLLFLFYTLGYEPAVSGGIAGCCGMLLAIALFLSKQVRCTGILFVMSIFMKHSRNLLLTVGTSLVVLRNIRNTLNNLTGLVRSITCNLNARRAAIVVTPIDRYVKMMRWVFSVLKGFPDLGVVKYDSNLKISYDVDTDRFVNKLIEAEQNLNETAKYARSVIRTVLSVADRMFPAISFLLLMTFIALHIKKYCNHMKYENTFISSKFICFDEKQKVEGKPHVLPLTPEEAKHYSFIPSVRPTALEGKTMLKFGIPVFIHFVVWVVFISVDASSYWFVDTVTTQLSELEPINIPLIVDITLLLYNSIAPLAAILMALLIMAMMAAKLTQLRLMVCERFFSTSAEQRVEHLHAKILRNRSKRRLEKADEHSLRSLIFKPHFWCPLLLRPTENAHNIA